MGNFTHQTDVLIIGGGCAGLALASQFKEKELSVALVAEKIAPQILNSPEEFNHPDLEKSCPRALEHYKERLAIINTENFHWEKMENTLLYENYTFVDLITLEKDSQRKADLFKKPTCLGAYAFNLETEELEIFLAKETVLAAGGYQDLFSMSSNTRCYGEGLSIAFRAGARILPTPHDPISKIGIAVNHSGRSSVNRLRALGKIACTGLVFHADDEAFQNVETMIWANSCAEDIHKYLNKFIYYFPELCERNDLTLSDQIDLADIKFLMHQLIQDVKTKKSLDKRAFQLKQLEFGLEKITPMRNRLQTAQLICSLNSKQNILVSLTN